MVFSSMLFVLCFLALNIVSQFFIPDIKKKNIAMLIFSLVFYSWAGPKYLLLLLLDSYLCWRFALKVQKADTTKKKKKHLTFCIILVLLVLGVFKYTNFAVDNLKPLLDLTGFIPEIALPIGISFYTFQLISYVVDVYRGDVQAQKKFYIVLLYASLFHQCIAGPIVRYADVEDDIINRNMTVHELSRGISRFTIGLAKKAILANSCAAVADTFLVSEVEKLSTTSAAGLILGCFAFMLQIYLDFSAYSDMAIGMGLMCGFHYKENFNYPYAADSITDFWRRWHISLSTFFRDYVYIPLGGNRKGVLRQIFNLLVVWALTGLWHGASWNYVLWGLYFFVFLFIEKFVLKKVLPHIPKFIRRLVVFVIIYFCWVLFKFEDFTTLQTVMHGMFCLNGNAFTDTIVGLTLNNNVFLLLFSTIACFPLGTTLRKALENSACTNKFWAVIWSIWDVGHPIFLLLLSLMALAGDTYNPFLYFRF